MRRLLEFFNNPLAGLGQPVLRVLTLSARYRVARPLGVWLELLGT
jgi:hypothetical protein